MIHIVFGRSAEGSLKYSFKGKNHKVIGFPLDFSVGPITNIHKNTGMQHYFTWLKSNYNPWWSGSADYQTIYEQALQQLLDVKSGAQITIWTCENAAEQIGLRICCYLLKSKEVDLNVVNTFKAMNDFKKHLNVAIRHTGECNAEELALFYEQSLCPISNELRKCLEQEGEELIQSQHFARSWKKGEIVHELETRDDFFILDCAKRLHNEMGDSAFRVAILIGEVIGHYEKPLSDAWIEYRIRSLIHSGHLMREGINRMYKVKVAK